VDIIIISSNVAFSRHDMAEILPFWCLAIITHLLTLLIFQTYRGSKF